jgi:hypothetical protein
LAAFLEQLRWHDGWVSPVEFLEGNGIMLENAMAAKMHSQETALFAALATRLTARRVTTGNRRNAVADPAVDPTLFIADDAARTSPRPQADIQKAPTAGKKRRWRRPLRMTPKAQRRRWFKQHNRRMRAIALRNLREAQGQHGGDSNPNS